MAYNGWSNYETWNCALWNDWSASADDIARSNDDKDSAVKELADLIESDVREGAPSLSGMYSDFLTAAIAEIDFYEIAKGEIAEVWIDREDEDEDEELENSEND